jgi:peroxidase
VLPKFIIQFYKSDVDFHNIAKFNLSDLTYSPHEAYVNGGLDSLCRGTIINPSLLPDSYFGDQLTNHLFDVGIKQGNDIRYSLSSINIQRGRDHGLLSYNKYRALVGLNTAKKFSDLLTNMSPRKVSNLQNVYANVNDIDLYAGGMSEQILSGAMVGQTFAS